MDNLIGYLAPEGFELYLEEELEGKFQKLGRLYLCSNLNQEPLWAENIWYNPVIVEIESISDAAKKLKAIQRNWALYPYQCVRRAKLIEEKLPYISAKPLVFGSPLPKTSMGSWTLLEESKMLFSSQCSSPFPNGAIQFIEDKNGPSSRAYLKLWEALTRLQVYPKSGEKCLEVGASPGGWTWVLASLQADVTAVDRAHLDPAIEAMNHVHFIKGDAFNMTPDKVGKVDWIFSDVICYPKKLYQWVMEWLSSGRCSNFVCTIKLQGEGDKETVELFRKIPGSSVVHLFHNKHELTWVLVSKK